MASGKVGAHTLGPIESRLKKGTYASDAAAADRNLGLLQQIVETPKVWKETKERATGLIRDIQAASERGEAPVAAAAAASKPTFLDRIRGYSIKFATGHYRKNPGEIESDVTELRAMGAAMAKAKEERHAATIAKIIENIETQRQAALAAYNSEPVFAASYPATGDLMAEMREGEDAVAAVANFEAAAAATAPSFAATAPSFAAAAPSFAAAAPSFATAAAPSFATAAAPSFAAAAPSFATAAAPPTATATVAATVPIAAIAGCAQLYDPCTREPLADIATLEARVRELKRVQTAAAVIPFPPEVITRLDLLLYVLNQPVPPSIDLLAYTQSGNLYEAYWDIVMCFGLISNFPVNKQFYLYKAKAEGIRTIEDPQFTNRRLDYLRGRRVMSGATGVSDITFMYKHRAEVVAADECSASEPVAGAARSTLYFCSSKYYKKDASKGVDKFDIQNIVTIFKHLPEDCDRKIVLFVNNRSAVESILKNALRTYISEEARFIYGVEDLIACLTKLYDTVRTMYPAGPITEEIIRTAFDMEEEPKPILNLRLHQHIAVDGIATAIRRFREAPSAAGLSNKFLVGILPRGGKTYIAGGLVHELQPRNIVVLLGAKSETLKQFKGELFEAFSNFQSYECVDVREELAAFAPNPAKKYIFIMSVELYKTVDSSRTLLQSIKTGAIPIDLFLCDEAHLKQTTRRGVAAMTAATEGRGAAAAAAAVRSEVVREELDTVEVSDKEEESGLKELDRTINRSIPVVYMTGTYIKPMQALSIPPEHTVLWDYQDIQKAKQLSTNEPYFRESFGPLYDAAITKCIAYGESLGSIESQYRKFPELYLLTSQFTEDAKAAFAGQAEGGVPTLVQLFRVKRDFNPEEVPPNLWHTGFQNPVGIMRLLNYLCPAHGQVHAADGVAIEPISSVMTTIDHIAQSIGDRLGFFTSTFVAHSQLWFLPHMQGHPLKKRMCALAGAIFQLPWFRRHFDVVAVSSSIDWRSVRGSGDKRIEISGPGAGVGSFSWKCPDPANEDGLKGCLVDLEASARARNKGLIILAQNMLHLGISLKCVDIVVLLDDGNKVDERIQKMYRALTESTNKKGGFIVDMNYFRTVTALMNYAIAMVEARTKRTVRQEQLGNIFRDVLNVYSFDIDKPDLKVAIDKTLPELQRLLGESRRSGGDSLVVGTAAAALNRNVETGLAADYSADYDLFLGAVRDSIEKHRLLRSEGAGVREATAASAGAGTGPAEDTESEEPPFTEILNPDATAAQKRAAYADIFKTTMKLGIFGTNAPDVARLIETLQTNEEVREILYDTLIKRGSVIEDKAHREPQKNYLIDKLIIVGLEKLIREKKNASYRDMKEAVEDDRKYPAEIQSVLEYIKDHLAPKDAERHKFGEVFTPMRLVHEMLDTLNETGAWNNPALTWLDPANGMGNFPIATFMRLFYGFRVTAGGHYAGIGREGEGVYNPGLTEIIPAEAERRHHIVQRMLFMVELNTKNIAISKKLFKKLAPGVEPNIIQMHRTQGFLAEGPMIFPNGTINIFDIVMGNPPFQGGAARGKTTNRTKKLRLEMDVGQDKHKNLWIPFVKKILDQHMKPDSYLIFIHPITWFKPDRTGIHDTMLEHQIHTLRIYDMYQAMREFSGKGKISVAYYLLQKTAPSANTRIIDRLGKIESIRLNSRSIIILAFNSVFSKIQSRVPLLYESDVHRVTSFSTDKCTAGANKQLHRINEKGEITFTKIGLVHTDQAVPKIFLSGYHTPRFFHDTKGEYGLIGSHQHYFVGSDLGRLAEYLQTKLSCVLLSHIKYDQEYIEPKYYPDIRGLPLETITDDTLADYFGFTAGERAAIAEIVYPAREYTLKELTCAQLKGEEPKGEEPKAGGFRHNRTRKIRRS